MSNLTTIRSTPSPEITQPLAINPQLARVLSIASNGLKVDRGDVTIYADRVPSERQKMALALRLDDLRHGLSPARPVEITKAMAKVHSTLVTRNAGSFDPKLIAETAIEDLGDLPSWAIEAACLAFRRGEAGDGHFAPTAAEIRQAAKRRMARFEDEVGKIEKIFNARVIDAPRF